MQFLCSSLFCARNLLTRRPGSCVARGPRPAVEEGKQDGEDGSVGAVRDTRGSRVRCCSDRHGLGTWGITSTVLTWRWRWWEYRLFSKNTDTCSIGAHFYKLEAYLEMVKKMRRNNIGAKQVVATKPRWTSMLLVFYNSASGFLYTCVCVCVSRIPEVESQTGDKEMKVTNGCKAKGLVVILWLLQSGWLAPI